MLVGINAGSGKILELSHCPPLADLPREYSWIAGSDFFDPADHVISAHEWLSAAVWRRIQ